MKLSTKHHLIPAFAVLAFIIGLSCSPRAIAMGGIDRKPDGWWRVYPEPSGVDARGFASVRGQ